MKGKTMPSADRAADRAAEGDAADASVGDKSPGLASTRTKATLIESAHRIARQYSCEFRLIPIPAWLSKFKRDYGQPPTGFSQT